MKIGDRVRVVKGSEQGIVTKILQGGLVEIEIEDGFQIPVLAKELVVVSAQEANYFHGADVPTPPATIKTDATKSIKSQQEDIFLSFKEINDKVVALYLINTLPNTLLFTFSEQKDTDYHPLTYGTIQPQEAFKIKEYQVQQMNNWPEFLIQYLRYSPTQQQLPAAQTQSFHIKAAAYHKAFKATPVLGGNSHLFPFKKSGTTQKITQPFFKDETVPAAKFVKPAQKVDLHFEEIPGVEKDYPDSDKMKLQMHYFENQLDAAIAAGMAEITFIHGVGNQTLRLNIHKYLSQHAAVAYFKDAHKEKFGYGATLVQLK